jgi:hypothetical protein
VEADRSVGTSVRFSDFRFGIGSVGRGVSVGSGETPSGHSACSRRTAVSLVLKIRVSVVRFRPWPPIPTLPEAKLDPDFGRGATDLLNAMKAAICLFDIELSQMRSNIRRAYRDNMEVLGIFPVAAYNGGPRNVAKLYGVIRRMGVKLEDLRPPGEQLQGKQVICPCLWKEEATGVRPVAIPKYNNENRWYIEKYQSILGMFE